MGVLAGVLPEFCEAATGEDFPEPADRTPAYFESIAEKLVGRTATITVAIRESEYNGEKHTDNQVKKIVWNKAKPKKKKRASKIKL